eukprot:973973-Amphidinium_carterae.1
MECLFILLLIADELQELFRYKGVLLKGAAESQMLDRMCTPKRLQKDDMPSYARFHHPLQNNSGIQSWNAAGTLRARSSSSHDFVDSPK